MSQADTVESLEWKITTNRGGRPAASVTRKFAIEQLRKAKEQGFATIKATWRVDQELRRMLALPMHDCHNESDVDYIDWLAATPSTHGRHVAMSKADREQFAGKAYLVYKNKDG